MAIRQAAAPPNNARARLAALREKKPPTKAAQIRALWPEIKAALDSGHSLKAVCECLAADGIAVSGQSLSAYVWRIRKKSRLAGHPEMPGTAVADSRMLTLVGADLPAAGVAGQTAARDPLANVRGRQAKRAGFDYRPELADPKDLI